jgi:hypothetical protein
LVLRELRGLLVDILMMLKGIKCWARRTLNTGATLVLMQLLVLCQISKGLVHHMGRKIVDRGPIAVIAVAATQHRLRDVDSRGEGRVGVLWLMVLVVLVGLVCGGAVSLTVGGRGCLACGARRVEGLVHTDFDVVEVAACRFWHGVVEGLLFVTKPGNRRVSQEQEWLLLLPVSWASESIKADRRKWRRGCECRRMRKGTKRREKRE